MTAIVWTTQAIEDLEAVRSYIARDSEHYADLMVERIVETVERLTEFPLSGRIVPEVGREEVREVIHGGYRIVYRYQHDVQILTVCHGARLLKDFPPEGS